MNRRFYVAVVCLTAVWAYCLGLTVRAENFDCRPIGAVTLRAGGGSAGDSAGGTGTGGSGEGGFSPDGSAGSSTSQDDGLSVLFAAAAFAAASFGSVILFRCTLLRARYYSKRYMKMCNNSADGWNYRQICSQVKQAYFAIQRAWTASNMEDTREYMTDALRERFQTKLSWMQYQNRRNVLKGISLLEAIPVSVHDDFDESMDYVWFYIRGYMVDYIVDMETHEIVSGNRFPKSFVEYWRFARAPSQRWVLAEILQKDEKEQIVFQKKDTLV